MSVKRCMRSRKALSHVDWAMSLAIFLLYLAWFFIFVKPMIVPAESIGSLLDVLEDGVSDQIFDDIQRVYIFIPGAASDSTSLEPVIVDFSHDWDEDDVSHSADYFEMDDGRMLFLANLSNLTKYSIYYPHDKVRRSQRYTISATETSASWADFRASFDEMLLDSIDFKEGSKLESFSIEVDDEDLEGDGEFTNLSLAAKYERYDDHINNTAYVFAENSRVYSYIAPNDEMNHSVKLQFVLYNYSHFYFDPQSSGDLTFSLLDRCKYYKEDFLDLYDDESGALFTFSDEVDYKLCTNNTNILLDIEFTLSGEENYGIYLHGGDYRDVADYPLAPIEGVTETLHVVSREKVNLLKGKDYDYLKQLFDYPYSKDFNITISGGYVDASYGAVSPLMADVYARKIESFAIDQDVEQEGVSILLTVW